MSIVTISHATHSGGAAIAEGVATTGLGVFDTLKAVAKLVIKSLG